MDEQGGASMSVLDASQQERVNRIQIHQWIGIPNNTQGPKGCQTPTGPR